MTEEKEQLINRYRELFFDRHLVPAWACRKTTAPEEAICPSVPFIGNRYFKQEKRILLYASAENLAFYHHGGETYLDPDDFAVDRHRLCFENNRDSFFPWVHIAPIDNGALSLAAFYLSERLFGVRDLLPVDFYETICFANYGKFTVQSDANEDYANQREKLIIQREYVRADTEILKPDYVFMVGSMYQTEKTFIDTICSKASIVPMYQINSRVINCHIHKNWAEKSEDLLSRPVRRWYRNMTGIRGITKKNYLSVFTYLDSISLP